MKLSFNLYTLLISRVQYISIKTYFYVWNMEIHKKSSQEIEKRHKKKYPTSESALGENIKKDTQVMEMLVVDGRNGCLFVWDRLLEAVTLKKPDTDFKHQDRWYSITHLTLSEACHLRFTNCMYPFSIEHPPAPQNCHEMRYVGNQLISNHQHKNKLPSPFKCLVIRI